jgi:amino acid transporter
LAWVAGIVSVLATLIAGANSQARMLFDGGRSGLLPAWLGRVHPPLNMPVNALLGMAGVGLGIIAVWWGSHLIGVDTGSMNPVGLYAECSTMGTIVILFVYFLTTLALPFFMWRRHRQSFSALRHLAIPALGALTLIVPFVELCKPGQPAPYSEFPHIALAIAAAATVIACLVVHRHPSTGSGEGTTFSES